MTLIKVTNLWNKRSQVFGIQKSRTKDFVAGVYGEYLVQVIGG